MATVKDRAVTALAALQALKPTRQAHQSPEAALAVVESLKASAIYDWKEVNAALFPTGDLSALNLSDPKFAATWRDIRQGHHDFLLDFVLNSWPDDDRVVIDHDGLSIDFDGTFVNPVSYHVRDVADVFVAFGHPFTMNGTFAPGDSWSIECLRAHDRHYDVNTLSGRLRQELHHRVYDSFAGYVNTRPMLAYNTPSTSKDELEGMRTALTQLTTIDWARATRKVRDLFLYEQEKARRQLAAAAAAAPKNDLSAFLANRIEKARSKQDNTHSLDMWNAFPVLGRRAGNANASRTYGVELEITDAGKIRFDAASGWKQERDHSLREQIGDGNKYDPWEFVSPILGKMYDKGLWMICDQADGTVKYRGAGVHVHVSATNSRGKVMTTAEVSRLLEIYNLASHLLEPVIQRPADRGKYCSPTNFAQWAKGWFIRGASSKPHRQRNQFQRIEQDAVENAKLWAQVTHGPNHDAEPTEWRRHQELNLQALNKYGTIEFRSMGPVYSYEYLTRWAWLCRELMNYAQSDHPVAPFYQLTTLEELLLLINATAVEKLSLPKKKNVSPVRQLATV